MKSLKKTILVALCVATASFASCSKQSEINPENETAEVAKPRNKSGDKMRRFVMTSNDAYCDAVEANCYPVDMILTGKPNRLSSALSVLESGINADIQDHFRTNRTALINDFEVSMIDGVIDGSLHGGLHGSANDTKVFVLFKDASTQQNVREYPIVQN